MNSNFKNNKIKREKGRFLFLMLGLFLLFQTPLLAQTPEIPCYALANMEMEILSTNAVDKNIPLGGAFNYTVRIIWLPSREEEINHLPTSITSTRKIDKFDDLAALEAYLNAQQTGGTPIEPPNFVPSDTFSLLQGTDLVLNSGSPGVEFGLEDITISEYNPDIDPETEALPVGLYLLTVTSVMEPPANNDICPVPSESLTKKDTFIFSVGDNEEIWQCASRASVDTYGYFDPFSLVECATVTDEPYNGEILETLRGWPLSAPLDYPWNVSWSNSAIKGYFSQDIISDTPDSFTTTIEIERFLDQEMTEKEIFLVEQLVEEVDINVLGPTTGTEQGYYSSFIPIPDLLDGIYLVTFRTTLTPPNDVPEVLALCTSTPEELESVHRILIYAGLGNTTYGKQPDEIGVSRQIGYSVNPFTGSFSHSLPLLSIPGRGLDVNIGIHHNSNFVHLDSEFGKTHWSFILQRLYTSEFDTTEPFVDILYKTAEGRVDTFNIGTGADAEKWNPPDDLYYDLSYDAEANEYILTGAGEVRLFFNDFTHDLAKGRLVRIKDRLGNEIQLLYAGVDSSGRALLDKIIDVHGRQITFYHNVNGYIKKIIDFIGREVKLTYYPDDEDDGGYGGGGSGGPPPNGNFGALRAVRYPEVIGNVDYAHDYTGSNRIKMVFHYDIDNTNELAKYAITKIKDAKGQAFITNTYAPTSSLEDPMFGRVISQKYGNGFFQFTYIHNPTSLPSGAEGATLLVIENDRKGFVTHTYYNENGNDLLTRNYTGKAAPNFPTTLSENRPTNKLRDSDPDFFESKFKYNEFGLTLEMTNPGNITQKFEYESGFIGSSATPIRRRQNKINKQTIVGTDSKMLVSSMTYDEVFHLLETATDPEGNITTYLRQPVLGLITTIQHPTVTKGLAATTSDGAQASTETFEYNSYGQLIRSTDGEEKKVEYHYYSNESPSQVPEGATPSGGYLSTIVVDPDTLQLTSSMEYDLVGNVTKTTDPNGKIREYKFNALNQLVKTKTPLMSIFPEDNGQKYESITWYDKNGNVEKVWNELKNSYDDTDANVTGFGSANHFETEYTYDILDQVIRVKQEVVNHAEMDSELETTIKYDKNDNPIQITYPNGDFDQTKFDERDLTLWTKIGASSSEPNFTKYHYSPTGKIKKVVGPNPKNILVYIYDNFDRIWKQKNAVHTKVTNKYDSNSNLIQSMVVGEQTPGGPLITLSKRKISYDERDRPYKTKFFHRNLATNEDIAQYVEKVGYYRNNKVFRTVNKNGNATHILYDGANRVKQIKDGFKNLREFTYDKNSNVILTKTTEKDKNNAVVGIFLNYSKFDELNRLRETENNLGHITHYNLDSIGLVALVIDAENNKNEMRYDGLGRQIKKLSDAQNGPITHEKIYDKRSRLFKFIDGNNNITTYGYDKLNRLKLQTNSDGTTRSITYKDGNIHRITRENGDIIEKSYDKINRLTKIVYMNSAEIPQIEDTFKYNGLNLLLESKTATSAPGVINGTTVKFQKDNRGLTLACTSQIWDSKKAEYLSAKTFTMEYNPMGSLLQMNYPSGRQVKFREHNALERPTKIGTNGFDPTAVTGQQDLVSFQFHGFGKIAKRIFNGNTELNVLYDPINRPISIEHKLNGLVPLKFVYNHNNLHSVISLDTIDEIRGTHYVRINQLDAHQRISASAKNVPPDLKASALANFATLSHLDAKEYQKITYGHSNDIQQIQTSVGGVPITFTQNEMNETTAISGIRSNIEYDPVGRMISYKEGGATFTHEWNLKDQLVAVYKNGIEKASYEYYPAHTPMRSIKRVNGGKTETFYCVADNIFEIYEYDETGNEKSEPTKEFFYQGMDSPAVIFTNADQDPTTGALGGREAYFYHANARGDICGISDTSGTMIKCYDYSLFGKVEELSPTNTPIPKIIPPSGPDAVIVSGTTYNFTATVANVIGDGAFTLTFSEITGTADASVATTSFAILEAIESNTYQTEGTITGITGEGSIRATLTYSEIETTVSSTFVFTVIPTAITTTLDFSTPSPIDYVIGEQILILNATGTPEFGTYAITITNPGDTAGVFSTINEDTGAFTFSEATTPGIATIEVSYTNGSEVARATLLINIIEKSPLANIGRPFLFGGAYQDETGYIFMRHRYYDPKMRTFLSRDPAADDSLGNLYAAFENNPGIYTDPMGLDGMSYLRGMWNAGKNGLKGGYETGIDSGAFLWAYLTSKDLRKEDVTVRSGLATSIKKNYGKNSTKFEQLPFQIKMQFTLFDTIKDGAEEGVENVRVYLNVEEEVASGRLSRAQADERHGEFAFAVGSFLSPIGRRFSHSPPKIRNSTEIRKTCKPLSGYTGLSIKITENKTLLQKAKSFVKDMSYYHSLNPRQWKANIGILKKASKHNIPITLAFRATTDKKGINVNPFMKTTAIFEEYLHSRYFQKHGFIETYFEKNPIIRAKNKVLMNLMEIRHKDAMLNSSLPFINESLLLETRAGYVNRLGNSLESLKSSKKFKKK